MELNFYDYDGLQPKVTPPNSRQCSIREKKIKTSSHGNKRQMEKGKIGMVQEAFFSFFYIFFLSLVLTGPIRGH